jgi:hypothetical protein
MRISRATGLPGELLDLGLTGNAVRVIYHHQIALGVDHGRHALRATSAPGRAYRQLRPIRVCWSNRERRPC